MEKWARANYQPVLPLGKDGSRITESKEHIALSKNAAKEGMVLLKNEADVLPLKKGSKVALFGKATFDYVKGGGGSGDVTVSYTRNLYEGLKEKAYHVTVFEELADFYRENVKTQYEQRRAPGMTVEPAVPEDLLKKAAAFTDTAVISISRFSGEGWDRKSIYDKNEKTDVVAISGEEDAAGGEGTPDVVPGTPSGEEVIFEDGDFYLTHAEKAMVSAVKSNFARVVVVLNVGGMVDTEWFAADDAIQSVLMAWQGGIEGGLAAAELLIGEGNPSGKLSDTFAKRLEDYPSTYNFHESAAYVEYTDDIYVGYRYFETIPGAAEKVNYPFGYGLSYTKFSLSEPVAEKKGDSIQVTVNVCNIGAVAGKEVVQVYYSAPQGRLGKPARELAAFRKTKLLLPGETQTVVLEFAVADMASYDDLGKVQKSAYVLEHGEYRFYVGTSVRDTRQTAYVMTLAEDRIVCQLSEKMAPTQLPKRMLADGSFEELPQGEPHDMDESVLKKQTVWEAEVTPAGKACESHHLGPWPPAGQPQLKDVAEGRMALEEFVSKLSDSELAGLLGGQPNRGVSNTFGYGNLPEYGVPTITTADGPAGLRINPQCGVCTTAWPCSTLLACTWDPELVERVGAAGGAEVKENNIGAWLTPAINVHRSPLCGRNFEYYSEDPYLIGKMAGAMVRGIQSNRIAATVKHFALNNKETNRRNSDSRASERAIREIYLKGFERIVKEAKPWSIMSSYNAINGHRASENRELLEDILRGEWGFDGMVTTDWWTLGEHYKEVKAGNDMKMATGFPERLLEAKEKGALSREEMEICAKRILGLILKMD